MLRNKVQGSDFVKGEKELDAFNIFESCNDMKKT